jgi:hypothetical protein
MYKIYDFSYWNLSSSFRWDKWEKNPVDILYDFRCRIFPEFSELSYQENYLSFRIKHFFVTKTTFIAGFELSSKKYLDEQIYESIIIDERTIPGHGNRKGYGRGKGPSKDKFVADTSVVLYNLGAQLSNQARISVRLAQSIFPKTGMSLEYVRQFPPSSTSRYLTGQEYIYSDENLLYDDVYTYHSHEIDWHLNQLLPGLYRLKVAFNYEQRNYAYPIFSHSAEEVNPAKRRDHQKIISIHVHRYFDSFPYFKSFNLFVMYDFIINQSNELYFDFRNQLFQIGVDFLK